MQLTKIFHFEMAHAIYGYNGACKNLHGHSYELHVTVLSNCFQEQFIPAPGFIIDFKEIKRVVERMIIDALDHKVVLSRDFIKGNAPLALIENLVLWEMEPTAENILLYIRQVLQEAFPTETKLVKLKLHETKDSYAEWINANTFMA